MVELFLNDEEIAVLVQAIDELLRALRQDLGDLSAREPSEESAKEREKAEVEAKQIVALYSIRRRISPPENEEVT